MNHYKIFGLAILIFGILFYSAYFKGKKEGKLEGIEFVYKQLKEQGILKK